MRHTLGVEAYAFTKTCLNNLQGLPTARVTTYLFHTFLFFYQNNKPGSFTTTASQEHLQKRLLVLESQQVLSFIHHLGERGKEMK